MKSQFLHRVIQKLKRIAALFMSVSDIKFILKHRMLKEPEFLFDSKRLQYFFHSYNNFGITERAIEIPILQYYLENRKYESVLEIGNVTNHYYDHFRNVFVKKPIVVDKFEKGYDVVNCDISKFQSPQKFDFIFSISTFEHMDSDRGRNPDYVAKSSKSISIAADNIQYVYETLLNKKGKFVITAPLGYAKEWDETFYSNLFESDTFSSVKRYLFKRRTELTWAQIEIGEGIGIPPLCPPQRCQYLSIIEIDKTD